MPELETDIKREVDLDKEIKASGFINEELKGVLGKTTIDQAFDQIAEAYLEKKPDDE
jgi:hypothetical protein